jgi:hypothetical protein
MSYKKTCSTCRVPPPKPVRECCDKRIIYCGGGCCHIEEEELDDLLYFIRRGIYDLNQKQIRWRRNKIGEDQSIRLLEIGLIRWVVEDELRLTKMGFETCLCCEDIQQIMDNVRGILGHDCDTPGDRYDLQEDCSEQEAWVQSGGCVAYDVWEKAIYGLCRQYDIVVLEEEALGMVYELIVNDEKKCQFAYELKLVQEMCEMRFDLVAEEKRCNLEFDIKAFEDECKIEYDLLVSETECKLGFDIFVQLRECGISYDLIALGMECGYDFEIKSKEVCPVIIMGGQRYDITSIDWRDLKFD